MASNLTMFDTSAFSQRLKSPGFTELQADAVTTGLTGIAMAKVATKDDVVELGKDLRSEIRDTEGRIVIRVCGATAVMLTIAIGVIKLV